jgi:hypothetical protein
MGTPRPDLRDPGSDPNRGRGLSPEGFSKWVETRFIRVERWIQTVLGLTLFLLVLTLTLVLKVL